MNVELRIERVPACVEPREYSGLLIYGRSAADWLNRICQLGIPTAALRFLPLGGVAGLSDVETLSNSSNSSRLPFAAIVFGSGLERFDIARLQEWNASITGVKRVTADRNVVDHAVLKQPRAECVLYPMQAYYCLAGRLFLPADARLTPWILESELRSLLPSNQDSVLVWHPTYGLLEFESNQLLKTADLLGTVDISDRIWNLSTSGPVLNSHVTNIRPEMDSEDGLLEIVQGPDGKAAEPFEKILLEPKAPDEVSLPGLRDAIGAMGNAFAFSLQILASAFKRLTSEATAHATGEKKEHLSAKRENALKRLLDLLQRDPDKGLKYAIPFGEDGGRGLAPPSSELGERSTDFQLSQLNSSGSFDPWSIPQQYEILLMRRYRELALRAFRLGQHRRAAYIYAKLLGDLNAAASVLESGRHYTDAAAIYLNYLHQPIKAANCLRAAGLWEDCVVIYRDQKQWIEAGDVYLQLDDVEQAHAMYRLKITDLENSHNQHSHNCTLAAEIAEQKLNDLDEAARLYITGWNSPQFTQLNLTKLLEFAARHNRHAQSIEIIERFAEAKKLNMERTSCALNVLSKASTEYPDADVRSVARAQCWQLASRLLTNHIPSKSPPNDVLIAIRNLAPEDELLTRDTLRFATRNQKVQKSKPAITEKQSRTIGKISIVGAAQVEVPENMQGKIEWSFSVLSAAALFLQGHINDKLVIGRFLMHAKRALTKSSQADLVEIVDTYRGNTTLIPHPTDQFKAYLQSLPGTRVWNDSTVYLAKLPQSFLSVLPVHSDLILSLTFSHGANVGWAMRVDKYGTVRLESIRTDGTVQYFIILDGLELLDEDCRLVGLLLGQDGLIILTSNAIFPIPNPSQARATAGETSSIDLSRLAIPLPRNARVDRTVASPLHTRVVIPLEEGVIAIVPNTGVSVRFATELLDPFVCTTSSGAYVLCCRRTGMIKVFRISIVGPKLIAESDVSRYGVSIDDVLSLHNALCRTQFVMVTQQGKVVQLKVELD